jgi:biopolymer transport protein ExbD
MRFKRRLQPNARVDLIPMIDVVFQLVVFFMVSSTFILTPGISLVLPSADTSEAVVMTKLVVTVADENTIFLNKEQYTLAGLSAALEEMPREKREGIRTVVIEGDRDIPYHLLVKVLDVLRETGFKGVNLKTRQDE